MKERKIIHISENDMPQDYINIIHCFLGCYTYMKKDIITAESVEEEYEGIQFDYPIVCFDYKEPIDKKMYFSRMLKYKGKDYIVELDLQQEKSNPTAINKLSIVHGRKEFIIDLNQEGLRDEINKVICSKPISPPLDEYRGRINTDNQFGELISNHEWNKINKDIYDKPKLLNGIYLINSEAFSPSYPVVRANFGTLLYQLISFRQSQKLDEKDLNELDNLIFIIRQTELLKLYYAESKIAFEDKSQSYYNYTRFTPQNGSLIPEKRAINSCIRSLKRK